MHWTMTMDQRKRGWLSPEFHLQFREWLLHSLARYGCVCPVYCVMPDHFHLLILGWAEPSDQRLAIRHLRKTLNAHLKTLGESFRLQKQAYDHILREEERARNAFERVAFYISENPVRAGLANFPNEWPFTGCMVPGYPELTPWQDDYWDRFWRLYRSKLPDWVWPAIDRRLRS
ncbi:MAG: hypothetical protein KDM64_17595 [Verrucomicrobiae bacterium]|nr:hypothetical protein [Verrucomicrobiae bacterium]